jgi:transposase-like protein
VRLDAVCDALAAGTTLTGLAGELGVGKATLLRWVDHPDRFARVREARRAAAKMWDEKAEQVLQDAADPFQLAKARELAQHYRWRATKIAPAEYGDRLELDHKTPPPAPIDLSGLSPEFKAELRSVCEAQISARRSQIIEHEETE